MSGERRHSGFFLLDDDRKKKVLLFHRPAGSDAVNLSVSTSRDGIDFVPKGLSSDLGRDTRGGSAFGEASVFRAGRLDDHRLFLCFRDHGENTLEIMTSETGARWKTVTDRRDLGYPTVLVGTKSADKRQAIAAFSAKGWKFITLSLTDDRFRDFDHRGVILKARDGRFDHASLAPLSAFRTRKGIVLVYTAKNRHGYVTVGAALFDAKNPEKTLWRSGSPLWTAPAGWLGLKVHVLGGANIGKYYYAYFQREGGDVETYPMSRLWETYVPDKAKTGTKAKPAKRPPHHAIPVLITHRLSRHAMNPILAPRDDRSWEAFSAFNAAAISLRGRIHLLYRAQGHDWISVLGHATTRDGAHILTRSTDPVFVPSNPFDVRKAGALAYAYVSGGGWGGCEDPRLTKIDERIYMTYVAFNGSAPPGVALTSIRTDDFGKDWKWTAPRLISRPGQIHKNWVLFPEKIDGKFAVLHNISPTIRIAYVDSLEDPDLLIDSDKPRPAAEDSDRWDNIVRGVGAPPIRTKDGWLVLYHAMDARDPDKYKVGAMLLDLRHPETVIARAPNPVLEPEADYENHGHKIGVVYVCGAVVRNGTLFVYYGASDRTLAVATAPLDRFVDSLRTSRQTGLTSVILS